MFTVFQLILTVSSIDTFSQEKQNKTLAPTRDTLVGTNISPFLSPCLKALFKRMFLFPKWDISVHWRVSSTLHLLGLRLRGIGQGRLELLLVERVGRQGIFEETKKTRCHCFVLRSEKLQLQVIRSNIPNVSKCPNPKKKIKHLDNDKEKSKRHK